MENNKIDYMKIIFIGTPEFGAIILEGLIQGNFKPILVITATDKPVGRAQLLTPPPVKVVAEKNKISVTQPEKIENCKLKIENLKPELIVVAAYGQIIPKEILDIPKCGCLNVHPSLLPKYRGPSPIQYAILNGDKETGVTIMLIDEKIDHGPIIAISKLQISNSKITYGELSKELASLGAKLLIETIPKWIEGKIKPKPQDESKAIYTKIISKEEGKIDWKKPAEDIERQIRAFDPWPGSYCLWSKNSKNLRIKILEAFVLPQKNYGPFGIRGKTFLAPDSKIAVQAGKDYLIIGKLQLEGGKPVSSEEFLRGYSDFIGKILE